MECTKCHKIGELMPKRSVCRPCYNEEKRVQRNARAEKRKDKQEQCSVCSEMKILVNGSRWCQECKNEYEKTRRHALPEDIKDKINESNRTRYNLNKEINKDKQVIVDENLTKICSICKIEKQLVDFHLHKFKGNIRAQCKDCASNARKIHYQENREKIIKQTTQYQQNRKKLDPAFKIEKNLRSRLYSALMSQSTKKSKTTMELTGCSREFLKQYLESQFTEGMCWENYGQWHIDHILPCCSFKLEQEEDQKKCFNYKNLQPLWGKENLKKGGRINTTPPPPPTNLRSDRDVCSSA